MIGWKICIGNLSDLKDDLGKTDKLDFQLECEFGKLGDLNV